MSFMRCFTLVSNDLGAQLIVIHTGLRGFARNNRNNADTVVKYRVCQEGIHYLVPHMKKRVYYVNEDDFRTAIKTPGKTMHLSVFSDDLAEQVRSASPGSIVFVLGSTHRNQQETNGITSALLDTTRVPACAVVMWKCRGESIDCLVAKVEIDGILSMLDAMKAVEDA
jgi:hypothetical protein